MKKGILFTMLIITSSIMANSQNPTKLTDKPSVITQTAGKQQLGDFAPKFAELNDDVLFGEVWSRTDKLALRDRSIVTVTALVASGIIDQSLTYHLQEAKKNGVTRTEIAEILTQIAFYAGWPKAWGAFRQAVEVWNDSSEAPDARQQFERELMFPIGEPNTAYAKYFIGNSYLAPISTEQVYPSCLERRRSDAGGRRRPWLVSGRGEACGGDSARYRDPYSGQCETLAWRGGRRLVLAPRL